VTRFGQFAQNAHRLRARQPEIGHQFLDDRRLRVFLEMLVDAKADALQGRAFDHWGEG
jgi:hypothetical protein